MSEKQPKKKKTAGDVVLTVVLIAAICVFCYAGYNLFHIYTEYKKGTDEYNSITQMAVTERDPDGEAAGPEAGSELKAPMDIDFASLKSVNDDVVGWIYVEAVPDINYPIVHGKDNETYLHRTYEKNYNFAGTIFVDYENKGDFSDCNTIVYGHNMKMVPCLLSLRSLHRMKRLIRRANISGSLHLRKTTGMRLFLRTPQV